MGKVYLPRNADWLSTMLAEVLSFPAGRNDDQVDVLSLIGRMLDTMVAGTLPRLPQIHTDRWDKAFRDKSEPNWKTY